MAHIGLSVLSQNFSSEGTFPCLIMMWGHSPYRSKNQGGMDWAHSPGGRVDDEAVAADDGEGSDFNALAVRRGRLPK